METKLERLESLIQGLGPSLVAYSGGVDSTLLASVAHEALGGQALAVTASSPLFPDDEIETARALAQSLGLRHTLMQTDQLNDPSFAANDSHRCYYCKRSVIQGLRRIAAEEGLNVVLDGTNHDDKGDYRPGRIANEELGVISPLMEVGLTKEEVRVLARDRGLPNWDKPSSPCLATRLPTHTPITTEALALIGKAERALAELGLSRFRVRHHGQIARIEASAEDMMLLGEVELSLQVVSRLRGLGYTYITLDMEGYRTGSMNAMGEIS